MSADQPLAPRLRSLRAWAPLWIALAVTLPVHAALITDDFRLSLFEPDGPCQYYDAYADGLLAGRADIDPFHVGNEAFLIGTRTYGYHGLTTAVLRMPLHLLFPSLWGHWERSMLLAAIVLTLLGAHLLAAAAFRTRKAESSLTDSVLHTVYLLLIGLGSTTLFLSSRPNVYQEAIAWAGALALLSFGLLARWLQKPSILVATSVAFLCIATLHARFVVGLGVVAAIMLTVALSVLRARVRAPEGFVRVLERSAVRAPAPQLALLVAGVVIGCGSYSALNFAKFGSLFTLPMRAHVQISPQRYARAGERVMSPINVPANAYNYLAPWNVRFSAEGALIGPVPTAELLTTKGMDYDWREPVIAVTFASPALMLLVLLSAVSSRKRPADEPSRWPLAPVVAGSAVTAMMPLLYHSVTQRYAHDMLALLAVCGALAISAFARLGLARQKAWASALVLSSIWSVFVWWNISTSYREYGHPIRIQPVRADFILPLYARELRRNPNHALILTEIAHILMKYGRPEQARPYMERALAIDPTNPDAVLISATLQLKTDKAGAIVNLQRAVSATPKVAELRGVLGVLLFSEGRDRQAVEQLRRAAELDPYDPRPRLMLSQALARLEHSTP